LVERLGGHPVEGGEIGIEDDPLSTQDENRAVDLLDRRQGLGRGHWCYRFASPACGTMGSILKLCA
jgi:hypothetical protein